MLNACRAAWKQRLPHKVAVFAWTIARQRVLTRVRHRYLFSTESALCMLCREHEEDCEHLFFKCPIAIRTWASQGFPRSRQAQFSGLQYRGGEEVTTQNGENDLRWYGPYGYTIMRWSLRGKRYQVRESSMRWRSFLVLGLSMCELEVMEGTMGHLFGLVTPFLRCMAVHRFG